MKKQQQIHSILDMKCFKIVQQESLSQRVSDSSYTSHLLIDIWSIIEFTLGNYFSLYRVTVFREFLFIMFQSHRWWAHLLSSSTSQEYLSSPIQVNVFRVHWKTDLFSHWQVNCCGLVKQCDILHCYKWSAPCVLLLWQENNEEVREMLY